MNKSIDIEPNEFVRLMNNFYISKNIPVPFERIALDSHLVQYFNEHAKDVKKKFKVALCCICLNEPYWEFAKPMIQGAKQFFLPGHDVDILFWSDMKEQIDGATIIPSEPAQWPLPTLFRYSLFLQEEERLKDYDYVFYCDIDMQFVNVVGDEILSEGLTAAEHPMYALRKQYWPPYEPNPNSAAYIKRPGIIIDDNGQPRFKPLYFAGGFQGGKATDWLEAMREMRKMIEKDFNLNYIPIWNDETVWNAYLFQNSNKLGKILTPSYIYPDSLIKEYYEPLWGTSYQPRLVTLTKKFTTTKEGGQAVAQMLQETKGLQ